MKDKFAWCDEIIDRHMHTLIAGCSGSGKSVAEHDILYTMMLRSNTENLFVLIDTKCVELVDFKDAMHTCAYVDEYDEVYPTLQLVQDIVDGRFKRMKEQGLKKTSEPTIWVVIDEYYDIITRCDKRCKDILGTISSRGRAAGVLLLVCTQRCTRDVLSGMIATNFAVKLGLKTEVAQDSRNIIRVNGCEKLPRYGKGILKIDSDLKEIDIPYVSEDKIKERIQYWTDLWNARQQA